MKPVPLTRTQNECLKAICALTNGGVAPSYQEVAHALGHDTGKGNISRLIDELERKGWVRRHIGPDGRQIARAIEVLHKPQATAPDIATLETMPLIDLRRHIAFASGILAHRTGGGATDSVLNRIGGRLAGRPVSQ
jgi:SOS-response transcriptional repressor LexA